jgi:hypothetical protein
MAYRRKTAPVRRKAPVRRRRTMGAKFTAAGVTAAATSAAQAALGGAAAALLTNTVGKQLGAGFAPYTGLLGSVATSMFLKQPVIAAGMAGYAGAKIGQSLLGADSAIGSLLAENACTAFLHLCTCRATIPQAWQAKASMLLTTHLPGTTYQGCNSQFVNL